MFPLFFLGTCLTKHAYGGNVFSPHAYPYHYVTKERQQGHSLFPTFVKVLLSLLRIIFLCKAAESHFYVLGLQDASGTREEVKAEKRSEEQEELQGALSTFTDFPQNPHVLVRRMRSVILWQCRWKISPLSIQKSICNAAEKILADLFSCSSAELMLFPHRFLCNQQLHKGDAQAMLSESLITESNLWNQCHWFIN